MIIGSGKFKKQWRRGKFSRKFKKQIEKEFGFAPIIPRRPELKMWAYAHLLTWANFRETSKALKKLSAAFAFAGMTAQEAIGSLDPVKHAGVNLEELRMELEVPKNANYND